MSKIPSTNKPIIIVNQANPAIFDLNLFLSKHVATAVFKERELQVVVVTTTTALENVVGKL